jgi:hypothetical protein
VLAAGASGLAAAVGGDLAPAAPHALGGGLALLP